MKQRLIVFSLWLSVILLAAGWWWYASNNAVPQSRTAKAAQP